MLIVKGHRVLVKPDPPKEQFQKHVPDSLKASGFQIALPKEQEDREAVGTSIGTVVAVGSTCWRAYDAGWEEWEPWCVVGDRITYSRYAGKIQEDPVDGAKYMLINDVDVHCIIEGEV